MALERVGFPEPRDRELQAQAERTWQMADELVEWAGKHVESRREGDYEVNPDEEFALYRLRRLSSQLCRSSKVPVAAAVYGASQTGKSLFMGRVLQPADSRDSPLGKDYQLPPDAYIRNLSFNFDINPQCGSQEATALVTRFTTKERFDEKALPEYPVKVCALTRAEWLRVLARGFRSECRPMEETWTEDVLRKLFMEISQSYAAEAVERDWRMDLIDTYTYVRSLDPRLYAVSESKFNFFLSQYPLTEKGYIEIAGRMFWDCRNFRELTDLFNDVDRFRKKVMEHGRDGILVHWGAVRFLLDSQRSLKQGGENSGWKKTVEWRDFKDDVKDGWYVLDYKPGEGPPRVDLSVIQAAMLELILPVIPDRLTDNWRDVLQKMDVLDLPGMRAGGGDSREGGATKVDSLDAKMFVVKRGKVFYLIDRYLEERQVQTLLLLVRGGNLEVRQSLKEYVNKFGRARYGDDKWPQRVATDCPALFLGMTGIDDEFKDRDVSPELYNARLRALADETFHEVMKDFGGPGQPFTNVFPVRYPGTWDYNEEKRRIAGPEKWQVAGKTFVQSEMVRKHVRNPEERWRVAMQDDDGGLSLISRGLLGCTTPVQKQDALQQQIQKSHQELRTLAEGWYCDPNANQDREKRLTMAKKVLAWLEHEEEVYIRVHALQTSLCFDEGEAMQLAEFSERRADRSRTRPESVEQRFPKYLKDFLNNWAREWAPNRWLKHSLAYGEDSQGWLAVEDFGAFARYLSEYLCCDGVFDSLEERLRSIVTLSIRDEGDKRQALREYVRVVLNDYVMNPGPKVTPLEAVPDDYGCNFGLMGAFLRRWRGRLPQALASAAGEHTKIPDGNDELQQLLTKY